MFSISWSIFGCSTGSSFFELRSGDLIYRSCKVHLSQIKYRWAIYFGKSCLMQILFIKYIYMNRMLTSRAIKACKCKSGALEEEKLLWEIIIHLNFHSFPTFSQNTSSYRKTKTDDLLKGPANLSTNIPDIRMFMIVSPLHII